MWAQLQDLAATVIDPDTEEFVDNFDIDATLDEFETTLGMSEAQDALLAAATEILNAWSAVKQNFQQSSSAIFEDSIDDIKREYDAMVDDQTHETTQKLMSIAVDVIDDIGESDLLEDAYNDVEGYLDTFNGWIDQDNWDIVYNDIVEEVEFVSNSIRSELEEGLPERLYAEELDHDSDDESDSENPEDSEDDGEDPEDVPDNEDPNEVPDNEDPDEVPDNEDPDDVPGNALSFAASTAALLASVAVISF